MDRTANNQAEKPPSLPTISQAADFEERPLHILVNVDQIQVSRLLRRFFRRQDPKYHEAVQHYLIALHLYQEVQCMDKDTLQNSALNKGGSIYNNRIQLRKLWRDHSRDIQCTWAGMSAEDRTKLLREAYPNIPQHHRPDIDAYRGIANGLTTLPLADPLATHQPQINLED